MSRATRNAVRIPVAVAATAAALGLAACGRGEHALRDGIALEAQAPARLSQTGLYSDIATRTIAPENLSFSPQYPLWTDGASKRRWIRLPAGSSIDATT